MENEEFWTCLTALLPSGYETFPDREECLVKSGDKEVNIVRNGNNFTLNGKTLHFEDSDSDVINTFLIPSILQEFDGNKRL